MLIYYVYAYLREDNSPYYIGKGKGKRAYDLNHKIIVPKDKSRIVFLETNLTELGALALERRYIRWYGRKNNNSGILRNLTAGGEGISGLRHTEESKQKCGSAWRGKPAFAKGKKIPHWSLERTGRKHTKTHKHKGIARPKQECPHCGKHVDSGNYAKYHGIKCKQFSSA